MLRCQGSGAYHQIGGAGRWWAGGRCSRPGRDGSANSLASVKFHERPVRSMTVGGAAVTEQGTLEDVYEPYFDQAGFLERTGRGRQATRLAFDHFKQKDLLPFSDGADSGNSLESSPIACNALAGSCRCSVDACSGPGLVSRLYLPSRGMHRGESTVMSEDLQAIARNDARRSDFAPAERALGE